MSCTERMKRSSIPTRRHRPGFQGITRLGEWLVRRGLISRVELFTALDVTHRHRCRLGDALVWLDILDRGLLEAEVRRFTCFAKASNMPRCGR